MLKRLAVVPFRPQKRLLGRTFNCVPGIAITIKPRQQEASPFATPFPAVIIRMMSTVKPTNNPPASANGATTAATTTAAPPSSWIDTSSWIPPSAKPYLHLARVDKQVGTMLLLWPCCWSVALASPVEAWPAAALLMGKFAVGAFVMRGAGCTINDLWDKG